MHKTTYAQKYMDDFKKQWIIKNKMYLEMKICKFYTQTGYENE